MFDELNHRCTFKQTIIVKQKPLITTKMYFNLYFHATIRGHDVTLRTTPLRGQTNRKLTDE